MTERMGRDRDRVVAWVRTRGPVCALQVADEFELPMCRARALLRHAAGEKLLSRHEIDGVEHFGKYAPPPKVRTRQVRRARQRRPVAMPSVIVNSVFALGANA